MKMLNSIDQLATNNIDSSRLHCNFFLDIDVLDKLMVMIDRKAGVSGSKSKFKLHNFIIS